MTRHLKIASSSQERRTEIDRRLDFILPSFQFSPGTAPGFAKNAGKRPKGVLVT